VLRGHMSMLDGEVVESPSGLLLDFPLPGG